MISVETIGYFSDQPNSQWLSFFGLLYPDRSDYIVFVSNFFSRHLLETATESFRRSTKIHCETGVLPTFAPGARSSDHWSFWKEGYRGFMVTDTAPLRYPYYHSANDLPDKLRYDFLIAVIDGLKGTVRDLATMPRLRRIHGLNPLPPDLSG